MKVCVAICFHQKIKIDGMLHVYLKIYLEEVCVSSVVFRSSSV